MTPAHIVPEWYLLPFYAILRAIPDKLMGVHGSRSAPSPCCSPCHGWTTSKVRSMRYRPTARIYFFLWILSIVVLGWCGSQEPDGKLVPGISGPVFIDYDINSVTWASRIASLYYFAYFLVITPLLGMMEKPLPVPDSLYTPVLPRDHAGLALPMAAE